MTIHAALWLDHEQAKIFFFSPDTYGESDFDAPRHRFASHAKGRDTHHRGGPSDQKEFFDSIAKPLAGADEILVLGPGTAKTHFLKHVHKHGPTLEAKIVGVETADHPSPGQIVAHARQYFRAKDQMLGISAG